MTAVPMPSVVDQPCVIGGMPTDLYHADPIDGGSLSSTGARMLLPPGCPAKYRWYTDHGQPPKREFDIGHAAHSLVLGIGDPIVPVDAADWRTKAAKEAREEAHDNGEVPLLAAEYEQVQAMAAVLRDHPWVGRLLDPDHGVAEQSLFWRNGIFGVWQRARLDWLTGRYVVDYKTVRSAEPAAVGRAMNEYGLHQQGHWYLSGARALGMVGDDAQFLLVAQEKAPPYVVTVAQPDAYAMRAAADRNAKALDVYAACQESGVWPGYADDVVPLPLPGWAEREHETAKDRGDFDIDWQLPLPKETTTT